MVLRHGRWRTLQWKLPLLITALLAAVMVAYTLVVYGALRHATVSAAEARAQSVSNRLAAMMVESVRRVRVEVRRLANDPALHRFMAERDAASRAAAEQALQGEGTGFSLVLGVEIRDRADTRLLRVGTTPEPIASMTGPGASRPDQSRDVWFSTLAAIGDTVAYGATAPIVRGEADTLGYLIEYRRLSSAQAGKMIRDLIDTDAAFLLGNGRGDLWTDLEEAVPGPKLDPARSDGLTRDETGPARRLGAVAEMTGTPWVVWVGMPEAAILAPVRAMLWRLLLMAAVILVFGATSAWIVSGRIAAPVRQLTRAAAAITAGDYSQRVRTTRDDELGRLATSFNSMAEQVEDGRRTLEARVEARTAELSTALEQLRDAQEELVRKEKLAFLGQLAGGVGHELRNPLGVMTNAVHYLELVLEDAQPTVREYLGILRMQIGLAERIVGDLLDSARVRTPEREPVAIGPLLSEQLDRAGLLEGIDVALDVAPDLPHACVDRVQISQVLLNLVTNAAQAMAHDGGVLTLRARRDNGNGLRVEVADTGGGIVPEHLRLVFEPLFTTKARGIGLGLAVARRLAQANGGELSVSSEQGVGATFTLLLPGLGGEGA